MKINCGPTAQAKQQAKMVWHRWFAWYPVRLDENDCRWLEYVERKGSLHIHTYFDFWTWEYRALNK